MANFKGVHAGVEYVGVQQGPTVSVKWPDGFRPSAKAKEKAWAISHKLAREISTICSKERKVVVRRTGRRPRRPGCP